MPNEFHRQIVQGATLDFTVNWTTYLAAGDTITTSTWAIEQADAGLTFDQAQGGAGGTYDDTTATVFVTAAGDAEGTFYLTNRITTSEGLADARTLKITAKERLP